MKTILRVCPLCNSSKFEVLFKAFYGKNISDFEHICICNHCGMVYKNPIVPEVEDIVYDNPELWRGEYFIDRARLLSEYIASEVKLDKGSKVLDIGAASGTLLRFLSNHYPESEMYGAEPATNVASIAARESINAIIFPAAINDIELPDNIFDLVTAIGVDYLFWDHEKDLESISKLLSSSGLFYLERNFFLNKKTLTDREILDLEDLFGSNDLFKYWFTASQFEVHLSRFFKIRKKVKTVKQFVGPRLLENYHLGYWCEKRENVVAPIFPEDMTLWYEQNKKYIFDLSANTSRRELSYLVNSGIDKVAVIGNELESSDLIDFINETEGLTLACYVSNGKDMPWIDELPCHVVGLSNSREYLSECDAVLLADVVNQQDLYSQIKEYVSGACKILPCFRVEGRLQQYSFESVRSGSVQIKAMLPATLNGLVPSAEDNTNMNDVVGRRVQYENDLDRAKRIHQNSDIILIHDHEPIADDFNYCQQAGITAKVLVPALDVDINADPNVTAEVFEGWSRYCEKIYNSLKEEINSLSDDVIQINSASDFKIARETGRLGIILGVEGCKLLEGDVNQIEKWYGVGLRQMQLTWAYQNQLSGSLLTPDIGLSDMGRVAINKMNDVGVLIDCTHASQKAFLEVLEISKSPILISHAGCMSVVDRRHKGWAGGCWSFCYDDDMRKLSDKGGILGIHLLAPFYYRDETGASDATLDDVIDHVEHAISIMGIDHVALGGDFFPNYGGWYELQKAQNSLPIRYVVSKKDLMLFTAAFLSRGYSDDDARKILGLNYIRLCETVWK